MSEYIKCDHCGKTFDGSEDFLEVNLKNIGVFLIWNSYNHGTPRVLHFCRKGCIEKYYGEQKAQ